MCLSAPKTFSLPQLAIPFLVLADLSVIDIKNGLPQVNLHLYVKSKGILSVRKSGNPVKIYHNCLA